MIEEHWRRICGIHCPDDGSIAAVWMALDKDSDVVHLYDACVFRGEVLAVISEGLNARGRWIPIAWHKEAKEVVARLEERGCNALVDHCTDSQAVIEAVSMDILERMRSRRFRVDKRLAVWLDEFREFERKDKQVPKAGFPLMAATRHAVSCLESARRQEPRRSSNQQHYRTSIV